MTSGHVGKGRCTDGTQCRPYPIQRRGQLGSAAPTDLFCYKGAGGGLAPELINIDHVFANAGDWDF